MGHSGTDHREQARVVLCTKRRYHVIWERTQELFLRFCRASMSGRQQPCPRCPWGSEYVTDNGDPCDCACYESGTSRSTSQRRHPTRQHASANPGVEGGSQRLRAHSWLRGGAGPGSLAPEPSSTPLSQLSSLTEGGWNKETHLNRDLKER